MSRQSWDLPLRTRQIVSHGEVKRGLLPIGGVHLQELHLKVLRVVCLGQRILVIILVDVR